MAIISITKRFMAGPVNSDVTVGVSQFVALLNQTLEFAYPRVGIIGELASFRVSKNRWVYFDLKDETASVRFFGTVYQLPGPLEDGMMVEVHGQPRLHQLYGFSVNVQTIRPVGEGSIKRAGQLLEAKLKAEGLFEPARKRPLPYPPRKIGLVTSGESAAYRDFMKILNARWGGVEVMLADVQVQGESAPAQIVNAVEYLNSHEELDVIVLTRGGGSADDLAAFSTEQVTRAVAGSRVPTLVAIGHEVDISLAELAADRRASTPSNAAELLVPDKTETLQRLNRSRKALGDHLTVAVGRRRDQLDARLTALQQTWQVRLNDARQDLRLKRYVLTAYNPEAVLNRGFAIVRRGGAAVRSAKSLKPGDRIDIRLADGSSNAVVE